jgi:hypothetical protein
MNRSTEPFNLNRNSCDIDLESEKRIERKRREESKRRRKINKEKN